MSVSAADIAGAAELFEGLGPLTTRRMVGGLCLYRAGTILEILQPEDGLYLKTRSADMIARPEAMGARRWRCTRPGQVERVMPYWSLPDAALDDPDLACDLARHTLRGY